MSNCAYMGATGSDDSNVHYFMRGASAAEYFTQNARKSTSVAEAFYEDVCNY